MHRMGIILSDKLKRHLFLKEACKSCMYMCMYEARKRHKPNTNRVLMTQQA